MKKFICVQIGARRNYAVPAILQRAGYLARLYTEICGNVGLGRAISAFALPGTRLERLANRRVPVEVRDRTTTFAGPVIGHAIRLARIRNDPVALFREQCRFGQALGKSMIEAGFGSATDIYSMLGEGGPFLSEARRRGLRIVSEVYIALSTERILDEERRRFPEWEPDVPDYAALRRVPFSEDVLLECSDRFLCPSDAVRDDLIAHWGVSADRATVVPYGVQSFWLDIQTLPRAGNILFVGTAELRKGIHYLAMAAEKLSARGRRYEFRIAGDVSDTVRRQPLCRHLTFLDRVPRARIGVEFKRADIFVLPSLAEGSAEVTYEALAAGLPVVTTKAAGSVVRDGIEGRIVPERDPDALAEAIDELIQDRELRNRMAESARARARDYTWDRYGERLVAALQVDD